MCRKYNVSVWESQQNAAGLKSDSRMRGEQIKVLHLNSGNTFMKTIKQKLVQKYWYR